MSYTAVKQAAREDLYPSRGILRRQFLQRRDPVFYPSDLPCPIDRKLVSLYRENGFLVLDDLFSENEVRQFQNELDRLRNDPGIRSSGEVISEPDSGAVRSVFRIHATSPLFRRLAEDPRLTDLASYLLGDQVYVHQSRVNYKPGFRGREFFWHSDFETWHVEDGMPRMRALSMSITLTGNYATNGPLLLIPGSHQHYVVCEGATPQENYRGSLKRQEYGVPDDDSLRQLSEAQGIVAATGRPGSVIVFDCNLMHGSGSNITPFPRSNVFLVYNAVSNRVGDPYCDQPPRPEFICSRRNIKPIRSNSHARTVRPENTGTSGKRAALLTGRESAND